MTHELCGFAARCFEWLLRRNPIYLVSAMLMALGARLYLVDPANDPGDYILILITLAALQIYEWMVGGVIILLHRFQRSTEDKPSLLLVAIFFWTGPLAATIELTAMCADWGLIFALAVCVIAFGELRFMEVALKVRTSSAAKWSGGACLLLLAVLPRFLAISDDAPTTNELGLYVGWWALAAVVLLSLGSLRAIRTGRAEQEQGLAIASLNSEMTFLSVVFSTTVLHLAGMNYAFFAHAGLFYASPIMIAGSVILVEYFYYKSRPRSLLLYGAFIVPAIAILLTLQSFHSRVPVLLLPGILRDPMILVAIFAAFAWWLAGVRYRIAPIFHAGSAALVLAAYRISLVLSPSIQAANATNFRSQTHVRLIFGLLCAAAYLVVSACIRRSRADAISALVASFIAVSLIGWPDQEFVVLVALGWSLLICMHIMIPRPHVLLVAAATAHVVITACIYDFDAMLAGYARLQCVVLLSALFTMGILLRIAMYRWFASVLAGIYGCFLLSRWPASHDIPAATLVVISAFALLLLGAAVSWHKQRLLRWAGRTNESERP